jgi:hypothetical protein
MDEHPSEGVSHSTRARPAVVTINGTDATFDLRYKREPRQTIGVRLGRNESGFRSNGTDIPPPTLPVIPRESEE